MVVETCLVLLLEAELDVGEEVGIEDGVVNGHGVVEDDGVVAVDGVVDEEGVAHQDFGVGAVNVGGVLDETVDVNLMRLGHRHILDVTAAR